MTHIILDIETLDTKPSAVMLEAAALVWLGGPHLHLVNFFGKDLAQQLADARTVSNDTVAWHGRTPAASATYKKMLKNLTSNALLADRTCQVLQAVVSEGNAMSEGVTWYMRNKPFDTEILQSYFEGTANAALMDSLRSPWNKVDLRDTMRSLPLISTAAADKGAASTTLCIFRELHQAHPEEWRGTLAVAMHGGWTQAKTNFEITYCFGHVPEYGVVTTEYIVTSSNADFVFEQHTAVTDVLVELEQLMLMLYFSGGYKKLACYGGAL